MKKIIYLFLILVVSFQTIALSQDITLKMPSIFSDNMVLQQKTNVKIWGKAKADDMVSITPSWGKTVTVKVNPTGDWDVTLVTPAAGGPHKLTVSDKKSEISFLNILMGEVWFCSGQSNMEMPLTGWPPNDTIGGSAREIAMANNPSIRLFNVQKAISVNPVTDCVGSWQECSSTSIQPFSATAYFFAKKLYEQLKVPIGLIESAWGGTPVESWISAKSLIAENEFVPVLNEMQKSLPLYNNYLKWIKEHKFVEVDPNADKNKYKNLDFADKSCISQEYNDKSWPKMNLPKMWEQTEVGDFDGVVWFRREVEVPTALMGKDLTISLGPIDDMDVTYFNGQLIGATDEAGFWQKDRVYTIPSALVKAGLNTIALRVMDIMGGGGIFGKAGQMYIQAKNEDSGEKIMLAGDWKYQPVAEMMENKFYIFDISKNDFFIQARPKSMNQFTASTLYNAMVNPVIPYTIKGAIWYQGESNVGRAKQYQKIFPLMIRNWRNAWNIGEFPFYYVQIAPWEYDNDLNATSSAELRNAQSSALQMPNTGMVVTLDIGNVHNIHPFDKQSVGFRLANCALAKDYNKKVVFSGPVYKSMICDDNSIRLQFTQTDGGLVAKGGSLKEFEIAGLDGKFVPAKAQIINNEVVVSSTEVKKPLNVRYCWRNGAEASLFNGAGLPASVFITE